MALLEEIRNNLASKVGDREFMTPTELEKYVMPISVRQQTKMRSEQRFPIPHHKVGKGVFYSIDAIVEYIVEDKKETKAKVVSTDINKKTQPKLPKKNSKGRTPNGFDLSHAFFLKNILDELDDELKKKQDLQHMLKKFVDSKVLYDSLVDELD
jgi:hypothetical protein